MDQFERVNARMRVLLLGQAAGFFAWQAGGGFYALGRAAAGDWLLFLDADMEITPGFLDRWTQALARTKPARPPPLSMHVVSFTAACGLIALRADIWRPWNSPAPCRTGSGRSLTGLAHK